MFELTLLIMNSMSAEEQRSHESERRLRELDAQRLVLKAERARLREMAKQEKRKRQRIIARASKLTRVELLTLAARAR